MSPSDQTNIETRSLRFPKMFMLHIERMQPGTGFRVNVLVDGEGIVATSVENSPWEAAVIGAGLAARSRHAERIT